MVRPLFLSLWWFGSIFYPKGKQRLSRCLFGLRPLVNYPKPLVIYPKPLVIYPNPLVIYPKAIAKCLKALAKECPVANATFGDHACDFVFIVFCLL